MEIGQIAVTQIRHPWRAVIRTVAAAVIALIPVLPPIIDSLGVATVPWVASGLIVIGAVTRVLALRQVETWLRQWAPALAAAPPPVPAPPKEEP
jgi:hypothetical protein